MRNAEVEREKTYAVVNDLLREATPIGAYCMAVVCAFYWRNGREPAPSLLADAVKSERLADIAAFIEAR